MLCGIPPFYDENVTEMYDLILKKPLEFDEGVSPAARDLLTKLLDRDPAKRMQSVEAFKAHPFFADLDFNALYNRQLPAPFKPDPKGTNNFSTEFTSLPKRMSTKHAGGQHANINGFTYNGDSAIPQ